MLQARTRIPHEEQKRSSGKPNMQQELGDGLQKSAQSDTKERLPPHVSFSRYIPALGGNLLSTGRLRASKTHLQR